MAEVYNSHDDLPGSKHPGHKIIIIKKLVPPGPHRTTFKTKVASIQCLSDVKPKITDVSGPFLVGPYSVVFVKGPSDDAVRTAQAITRGQDPFVQSELEDITPVHIAEVEPYRID